MAELVKLMSGIKRREEVRDTQSSILDTRSSILDSRSSILDPQSSNHDPRPSILDPRASGKEYWRSLEELADTEEFQELLHREFPVGSSRVDLQACKLEYSIVSPK